MRIGRSRALCGMRPAASIICTNGLALPSAAGSSVPSTRTSRLSIPRPDAAAMRCSMVWMRVPFLPIVVA